MLPKLQIERMRRLSSSESDGAASSPNRLGMFRVCVSIVIGIDSTTVIGTSTGSGGFTVPHGLKPGISVSKLIL